MFLYHTSGVPIRKLTNQPMFFAIELEHALDGWYQNQIEEGRRAAIYKFECDDKCNIVKENDNTLVQLVEDNDIDLQDYMYMLLENPDQEEIEDNILTQLMIANGIDGLYYEDYDPRNFDNDLEAVILFRPANVCKSWKRIK